MSEFAKHKFMLLLIFVILGIYFLFIKSYVGLFVIILLIIFRIRYNTEQEELYETIFDCTFKDITAKYGVDADVIKVNSLYYGKTFIPLYTRIKGLEKLLLCLYENNLVLKLYDRCLDLSNLPYIEFSKDALGYNFESKIIDKYLKISFAKATSEQIAKIKNIINVQNNNNNIGDKNV